MNTTKRWISEAIILLSVFCAMVLFMPQKAEAKPASSVYVGGNMLDSTNPSGINESVKGTASFDAKAGTLRLNNFDDSKLEKASRGMCVYGGDITIIVSGKCEVGFILHESEGGSVTIKGNGTLVVRGDSTHTIGITVNLVNEWIDDDMATTKSQLIIEGAKVTVNDHGVGSVGNMTIKDNGSLINKKYGISTHGNIRVHNGTMISSGDTGGAAIDAERNLTVSGSSTVIGTGKGKGSIGIRAGRNMTIDLTAGSVKGTGVAGISIFDGNSWGRFGGGIVGGARNSIAGHVDGGLHTATDHGHSLKLGKNSYIQNGFSVVSTYDEWMNSYGVGKNGNIESVAEITTKKPSTSWKTGKAGWKDEGNGFWRYYKGNGKAAINEWVKSGEKWYYLGSDGLTVKGWFRDATGEWYKAGNSGQLLTGWQKLGTEWYCYNADGQKKIDQWTQSGGNWYYVYYDGSMITGWLHRGYWYYLSNSGAMQTGWVKVDNKWYYMDGSGAMQTGWWKSGSSWYYLRGSGAMATGWVNTGKWYYMNASGSMATGWVKDSGKWYYMNGDGSMATGWKQLGGKWYYLSGSGAMLTGTHTIGGKTYTFDGSGAWVS